MAPVIESLKQLTRYSEAEMMAAVINGFFTVFVTSEKGTAEFGFSGVVDDDERVSDDDSNYELGPGMVNMLAPGEKIDIADAKRPSTNFDAFVTSLAKYVGAALEIPVELLIKSFNASYSASRAALLEAWKAFRMKRDWLASDLCQPIYEIFLNEAIATGRLKAPGFFLDPVIRMAYCGAQWNGPAPGMLDPGKEVDAAEKRIAIGLSTRQKETIEMSGGDFDSNIAQLARENKLMKAAGLLSGGGTGQESKKEGEDKDYEKSEDGADGGENADGEKSADDGGESGSESK